MKYPSLLSYIKKNDIFFISLFPIVVWFLIFGNKLIYEPYVWDDLHFFRNYSISELLSTWVGNWDPDNIETPSYRPIAVLYYHITYLFFNENTVYFRVFLILLIFLLLYILNNFLLFLKFEKKEILIFSFLITFSKIFTTLVSWFTISVLIVCYIFALSSAFMFIKYLEKKNIFLYLLSFFFGCLAVFIREELYILPGILFLTYFLKFELNRKNIFSNFLKTLPFFFITLSHMYLRKKFIPEADHFGVNNFTLTFGDNILGLGGVIKVIKSSFLPMGYLSSQYSDNLQIIFSLLWMLLISIGIIFALINFSNTKKNLKRNTVLFLLVLICSIPHIAIARSFGIFLPSIFAILMISNLINYLFNTSKKNINRKFLILKYVSLSILIIGVLGGAYRSNEHIKSMSQFSTYIVYYDNEFIYGYKQREQNLSIPKIRYLKKKEHLMNLNILDFKQDLNKINSSSKKIKKSKYDPLWF